MSLLKLWSFSRKPWPALAIAMVMVLNSSAQAQEVSAALRDRVGQLLERLEDTDTKVRDAAEKALIDLGARILPVLPEPEAADSDLGQRLQRVRQALEQAGDDQDVKASRVTIKGQGIRLSEALRQLQSQSGNRITDLRELYGQDATNPGLDLDIQDKPFLEALDIIADQAELTTTYFTGDGTVGLVAGDMMYEATEGDASAAPPRVYTGPFRVVMKQYAVQMDLATGARTANLQFEIDWEPRLRPMLLTLDASNIEISDDTGEAVEPMVAEESGTVVLRPENPAAELNLNMTPPPRSAQKLATLKVKADMTVPAANQVFRFPNLTEKGATQERGEIQMKLLKTEVEDFVWKVDVEVAYNGEGEAFETYRQGLFNNRIWLQRADGSRFEHNGGFNQIGESGSTLRFQYLFVDAPGKPSDYQLVYETPSKVEAIPVEFTFTDIPLP